MVLSPHNIVLMTSASYYSRYPTHNICPVPPTNHPWRHKSYATLMLSFSCCPHFSTHNIFVVLPILIISLSCPQLILTRMSLFLPALVLMILDWPTWPTIFITLVLFYLATYRHDIFLGDLRVPLWSNWQRVGPQFTTIWVRIWAWAYPKVVSYLISLHYHWSSLGDLASLVHKSYHKTSMITIIIIIIILLTQANIPYSTRYIF